MACKVLALAYLLVYGFAGARTQCVPEPVFYIYLEDTTLSWERSTNCEGTSYVTTIHATGVGAVEYAYQGEDNTLDVSFLPFCRSYVFTVSPIADNHVGPHSQIIGNLGLPEGTDIAVANITGSQIENNVLLEWAVLSQYSYCLSHYKLLLWNEDSTDPEEITTDQNGYYITDVPYCMSYQVDISVVQSSKEYSASRFNYTTPSATNNLYLQYLRQNSVTINTTWALDGYSVNRCEVTALHASGSKFNVTIPVVDTPERQTLDINIAGLQSNSMYYFNVTVENVAGISRPFQLAVQTLPLESRLNQSWILND